MSEGKHTPGPWHYGSYLITSEPGNVITGSINYPIKVADGRLIAAAPDLLEALRLLHDDIAEYARINNLGGFDNHVMKLARAAIAKAEGQAE